MTWQRFWSLLLRQWRLIGLCCLMGGAGAFMVSKLVGTVYASAVLVQVTVPATDGSSGLTNVQASIQLAQTEARLATSYPLLQQIAPHYENLTGPALVQKVSATARPGTALFEVDVQDSSPEMAARLANDIANVLIQQQLALLNQSDTRARMQIQQELMKTHDQINTTIAQLDGLSVNDQAKVTVLQAQLEAQEQYYAQWQTRLAQLDLSEAQGDTFLRVVQPAVPNYTVVRPDILKNIELGLLVGFFLGVLSLVLYDLLDARVHTIEAVRNVLEWPLLGTIWRAHAEANEQAFNPHGHEMNAEAYRILRTNLGFTSLERSLRTLAVVSAGPSEGKSTVAANLAIFMARAGKNTLLIDTDLRRPTLHTLFQLAPDRPGLSNAMVSIGGNGSGGAHSQFPTSGQGAAISTGSLGSAAAQLTLESFFHYVGVPNLRVMPSGPLPPNPAELLESRAMQRLIALLTSSSAEVIIFDTPPAVGLADVSILAAKVGGVLVVVDPAIPTRTQMRALKASLSYVGAQVVGFVVNRQLPTRDDASIFSYYKPVLRVQGILGRIFGQILKKEYLSPSGATKAQREKRMIHTVYHGRNP